VSGQEFKVALLGAGFIGDFHLEALRHVPNVTVVGVCDLSRARADRLASRARGGQARGFTSIAELVAAARPDVVHVLTPPEAHDAPTRAVLEQGVSVFIEKPLSITSESASGLAALAAEKGLSLGTGHNFLFAKPYERLLRDIADGRLGRVEHVDVTWNKFLPQVQFGPFGSWLFRDPRNVLFEVAPHSFAHAVHLVGELEHVTAHARDAVRVPSGPIFYRQWEVYGAKGRTDVRLHFSFVDGYTEHTLHVRGTSASATVDFELNAYALHEHSEDLPDLDHFATAVRAARDGLVQAGATLGSFVLSKAGLPLEGGPYQASITRATKCFYEGLRQGTPIDVRLSPALAVSTVRLAEAVARAVVLQPAATAATSRAPVVSAPKAAPKPTVLVLGATGFIGRALVKRLRADGLGVRALVRDKAGNAEILAEAGAELVKGDFTDARSVEGALEGIADVYHLARGTGKTYDDYDRLDVQPTVRLAELCAAGGRRLYYTSSIAIYHAGVAGEVITEDTAPSPYAMQMNVYSRAKVENERRLVALARERGLEVVIFRPGVVIGDGGSPFHWGVGAWPYNSICRIWGDGHSRLPFVLVDDCADAMVRARAVSGLAGQSFNLVADPVLTGHEYLDELERLAGMKVRRLPTPTWRLFAEDIAKTTVKSLAGLKSLTLPADFKKPSYQYYEGLSCRATFSPARVKQALGWSPTSDRAALIERGIALPVRQTLA
jgi:nucleoside-diphosphate-sugar epimerase/predicted dehydrogenase